MKITQDDGGNVTIEMDNADEPGYDVEQDLISESGVSTLIVRCKA